jgi:hypothetical protein
VTDQAESALRAALDRTLDERDFWRTQFMQADIERTLWRRRHNDLQAQVDRQAATLPQEALR